MIGAPILMLAAAFFHPPHGIRSGTQYCDTRRLVDHSGGRPVSCHRESTVRAYAAPHKMPEPDAYVGATKLWRQETIKEWARNRPRKGKPGQP
jgi:hypothetical protein